MDDDDFGDDQWLTSDALDAIDQQLTQFANTQEVPQPIIIRNQPRSSDFPTPAPLTAASTFSSRPAILVDRNNNTQNHGQSSGYGNRQHQHQHQQQQQEQQRQQYDETQVLIDNLRFTEERLHLKLAQEVNARENMHHELEHLRSEMRSRDDMLVGLRFEVESLRKIARAETAAVSNNNNNNNNSEEASSSSTTKKSIFPDGSGFSDTTYRKKSSSLSSRSRSATPSPGPAMLQRAGRKRTAEAMVSTTSTVVATTATNKQDKLIPSPVSPPPPPANTQHIKFLRSLLGLEYSKMQEEQDGPVEPFPKKLSPALMGNLCARFSQNFNPKKHNNLKLAMLATDITDCINRSKDLTISITVQQLMSILGHVLSTCIKERLFDVLSKSLEIFRLLTSRYRDAIQYLIRDFKRAEEDSILWKFIKCFTLYDVLLAENDTQFQPHVADRDIWRMEAEDIHAFCQKNNITPAQLDTLIKYQASIETSHASISSILDIFIQIASIDESMAQSLHFLLKQSSFLRLLSTSAPFKIITKVLELLTPLVACDDLTAFMFKIDMDQTRTVSTVTMLSSLLTTPGLSQDPYDINDWFTLRTSAVCILYSVVTAPESMPETLIQQACVELFTPLQHLIYDECARLNLISEPPYPAIRLDDSEQLINSSLDLLYPVLKHYGATQRLDYDQYYLSRNRMKYADARISSVWGSEHPAKIKITRINEFLKTMHAAVQPGSDNNTTGTK